MNIAINDTYNLFLSLFTSSCSCVLRFIVSVVLFCIVLSSKPVLSTVHLSIHVSTCAKYRLLRFHYSVVLFGVVVFKYLVSPVISNCTL